jgi:predicted MFS family arabinose efflux permease
MAQSGLRVEGAALFIGYSVWMTATSKAAAAPSTHSAYRFVVYGLLLGVHLATGVNFLAPASLLPLIMDEYAITLAAGGFLVTSMTLVMTVGSIPVSVLAVRWPLKHVYGVGLLLLGVGALAPLFSSFLGLVGLRLVQGLGAAVLMPLAAAVVMRWAPEKEVPVINAANLAALTAGMGVSQLLGPFLADAIGWLGALGVEGGLGLAVAVLWLLLARERSGQSPQAAPAPMDVRAILRVFRLRATWLLAFAVIGPWAQFITLSTWLPTYYTDVRGLDLGVAAFTASVFTFVGIPASILGGILTARTGKRRPFLIWTGLLLGAAGLAAVVAPAGIPLYLAVLFAGFIQWVYEPALFTIPIELPDSSPERAGAIWAAILTTGNASSFVAPVVVGLFTDVTGSFLPGFVLVCVSSLSILVAALLLPETGPGRQRREVGAGTRRSVA